VGRKDDLERRICDSYDIVRQYEEITHTSDRPEEVQRAERKIEEQWKRIKADFAQYQTLCQRLGKPLAEDVLEIAATLDADAVEDSSSPDGGIVADREVASLHARLEKVRENLLLIRERKAEYVMETDIPLDLIRRERQLEQQIADLEAQLG
jgi:DNA repair exonuclease SbcCD ATPase subunit